MTAKMVKSVDSDRTTIRLRRPGSSDREPGR